MSDDTQADELWHPRQTLEKCTEDPDFIKGVPPSHALDVFADKGTDDVYLLSHVMKFMPEWLNKKKTYERAKGIIDTLFSGFLVQFKDLDRSQIKKISKELDYITKSAHQCFQCLTGHAIRQKCKDIQAQCEKALKETKEILDHGQRRDFLDE